MNYSWQHPEWANFSYNISEIEPFALDFAAKVGEFKGLSQALTDSGQIEAFLQLMISEAAKTSQIEGEIYSREDLLSSIKKKLGIHENVAVIRDKKAQGIASLMVYISKNYHQKLTEKSIKDYHQILMEVQPYYNPGQYRSSTEPMQVISGPVGKETVHFEAPPSERIRQEMKDFVKWYNDFKPSKGDFKGILIKTSLAHLYFETIHPFEDGNGRIGRALAEKCLSEFFGRPLFVSLSTVIERDKKSYYGALKNAQKKLEVTDWICYFSKVLTEGVNESKNMIRWTVEKTKFLDKHKQDLNDRQLKAILKIFDAGSSGFEGGMTAKKYVSINKTSRATATRDLQELCAKGLMIQFGEGRSVGYSLNLDLN